MAGQGSDRASGSKLPESWLRWLSVAALLPWIALPLLAVARKMPSHTPSGDLALLELGMLDALAGDQLLGPYSQHGFRHPGPALFYLLALPYRLSGERDYAIIPPSVALLNAVCLVLLAALWLRRSRGGTGLGYGWSAAVMAVLALYLGPDVLASPWAPNVTVLPLLVALSAFAAAAAGRLGWLPVAVVAGSFCAQTHVGHVLSIGLVGGAASMVVATRRRGLRTGRQRWYVVVSCLLAIALWLPPLVEQLSREPGNLSALATFAAHRSYEPDVGAALTTLGARLGAAPLALLGVDTGLPFGGPGGGSGGAALVGLAFGCTAVVLVVTAMRAWRWRPGATDLRQTAAIACLGAALAAGAWALLIEPPILPYLVRWTVVVGVLGLLAVRPSSKSSRAPRRRWASLGLGLLLVLLAARGAWAVGRFDPTAAAMAKDRTRRARVVSRAAVAAARGAGARTVAVRFRAQRAFQAATTVAAQLVKAGYELRIDPAHTFLFGQRPAASARDLQLWVDRRERVDGREDMRPLWHGDGVALARFEPERAAATSWDLGSPAAWPYLLEGWTSSASRGGVSLESAGAAAARLLLPLGAGAERQLCFQGSAAARCRGAAQVALRLGRRSLRSLRFAPGALEEHCTPLPLSDAGGVHELLLSVQADCGGEPLLLRRLAVRGPQAASELETGPNEPRSP
ncbi:MAG: hypothetical protein JRI23_17170 [Deltaproteobacteria bacterium]|nr:hypothetical protein [Deltaproteobacteria bacterium]MBW2533546.1 hypothetical protein [Deltaproteobacteria bacterium]